MQYDTNDKRHAARSKTAIVSLGLLLLGLLLAPSVLLADWVGEIEISIPFPFVVEGEQLPAGDYTFSTQRAEPNVLLVRSREGDETLTAITTPYEADAAAEVPSDSGNPRLVFEQLGKKNYLSEVHIPRRSLSWRLDVPDEIQAHLVAGKSLKTSVEGRESQ